MKGEGGKKGKGDEKRGVLDKEKEREKKKENANSAQRYNQVACCSR